jgi:hypothetical protein
MNRITEKYRGDSGRMSPNPVFEERDALKVEVKELREILYVYENTPFSHWMDRALKAEAEITRLYTLLFDNGVKGEA